MGKFIFLFIFEYLMSAVHLRKTWFLLFHSGFFLSISLSLFLSLFFCIFIRMSFFLLRMDPFPSMLGHSRKRLLNTEFIIGADITPYTRCTLIYSYDVIIATVTPSLTSSSKCNRLNEISIGQTVWIFEIVISRRQNDGPTSWYLRIVHISYSKSNQVNWQYKMQRRVIQEFIDVVSISK